MQRSSWLCSRPGMPGGRNGRQGPFEARYEKLQSDTRRVSEVLLRFVKALKLRGINLAIN
jgi:hypothetical protein